jgi:selenide,water dikinase
MMNSSVIYKELVLIGGGHAHPQVVKMWAMKPLPGVRLTLISPQTQTPYSGMLPGLIAGHYTFDEMHIDLMRLCQYAGARFIKASVSKIDLNNKQLLLSDSSRPAIGFDLLSINSGITPDLSIQGAAEHGIAVKPISDLYPRWQQTLQKLKQATEPVALTVIGGGAAGIELIFAMHYAITQRKEITAPVEFHLVFRGKQLPTGYPKSLQKAVERKLKKRRIHIHRQRDVSEITDTRIIFINDTEPLKSDTIFWCTNAKAAEWPKRSGLATDANGFIALKDTLQSTSHDFVFAAGDIAQQLNYPRPHAGVFAVRQGPVLFKNLQRKLLDKSLKKHRPQKNFLSLLTFGTKSAIGHRRFLPSLYGSWVWRLKDSIDRRFMAMFSELKLADSPKNMPPIIVAPAISGDETPKDISALAMRCGGCGAKVGATTLSRVINQLQTVQRDDVVWGLDSPDDAAAIRVNNHDGSLLLQSVDIFRAFMDEPYLLGQIAAEHALSDLFAMNALPQSAMAIATLPFAGEKITERDLLQLMSGAVSVLNKHGCTLTGGHTSEGAELSIGFSVNGLAQENNILQKASLENGDVLILTQPLGTGTLFAAHARLQAQGKWIDTALTNMLQSNRIAGEIFHAHQASACTDITGFGLLGHLVEMLKPNGLNASLKINQVPVLDGAIQTLAQGITSSLQPQNIRLRRAINNPEEWASNAEYQLLFDPQTSGGLLAGVPDAQANQCLKALRQAGYSHSCIIGYIEADGSSSNRTGLITLLS